MQKAIQNAIQNAIEAGPPPSNRALEAAIGLLGWLDDLLDLARDRGDAALACLVASVMDDLGEAANGR